MNNLIHTSNTIVEFSNSTNYMNIFSINDTKNNSINYLNDLVINNVIFQLLNGSVKKKRF